MIQLDLNQDEREILTAILRNYLSDLRMEISHTDRMAFREQLKLRKQVLKKVLATLQAPETAERG